MLRRLSPTLALALLLVPMTTLALPSAPLSAPSMSALAEAEPEVTDHVVESFDNTPIHVTVFRPAEASATAPVPLVLHSHGWSGSRATSVSGFIEVLLDNGYGVLSIDMRGHGASGGAAHVHNPDYEIRDVSAVLDWAHENLVWTIKQDALETGHAKDTLAGAIGGSYGGGYQLLTAALDGRLDALAPEITWNDLPYALAPNAAIKSDWVHLLYAAGNAFATLGPEIHEAYREAMLTNEIPETILAQFETSSPAHYPDAIDVPTLLIQGIPDTLFNLNQAVANLEQIQATGTDVRLFTHLGGHLLNVGTIVRPELSPVPVLQPGDGGSPCGDMDALRLAWFDEHLKGIDGAADGIPVVSLALDDGASCLTSDAWPVEAQAALAAPAPVVLNNGLVGPSVLVPLTQTSEATVVAGIPRLSGQILSAPDVTLYFSLAAVGPGGVRVLDSQVTPLRLKGVVTGEAVGLDLGGVAGLLDAGEALALKVDVWNEQYATNSGRVPGAVVLSEIVVSVPLVAA